MSVKILNINLNYNYRDLSETDIGNKSNTLLRKDNMQSNPLNAEDLSNIFNTSNSNV